jgi:hypothetical protein
MYGSTRNAVAPVGASFCQLLKVASMKTPQRNFVVEYRSGRRQPKVQTNSIWGDTDLKALAREVEHKAPHLFISTEAPTSDDGPDILSTRRRSGSENKHGEVVDSTEIEVSQPVPDLPAAEAVSEAKLSRVVSQVRARGGFRNANRASTGLVADIATGLNEVASAPSTPASHPPVSVDELAILDTENRRLKGLLAEQLRVENSQLKKMLERFDVTEGDYL